METAVSTNSSSAVRGGSLTVTDTAKNQGTVKAEGSLTYYYLSTDTVWDAGDRLLTGKREVQSVAAGASSTGTVTVTIPSTTALNSYYVLACADDAKKVPESNETNNCGSSVVMVLIQ